MPTLLDSRDGGCCRNALLFLSRFLLVSNSLSGAHRFCKRGCIIKLRCVCGAEPNNKKERSANDKGANIFHAEVDCRVNFCKSSGVAEGVVKSEPVVYTRKNTSFARFSTHIDA